MDGWIDNDNNIDGWVDGWIMMILINNDDGGLQ